MILVKNITTNKEMKVRSTVDGFVSTMNSKPNCKVIKSQTGRYLMTLKGVLMRLEICSI